MNLDYVGLFIIAAAMLGLAILLYTIVQESRAKQLNILSYARQRMNKPHISRVTIVRKGADVTTTTTYYYDDNKMDRKCSH